MHTRLFLPIAWVLQTLPSPSDDLSLHRSFLDSECSFKPQVPHFRKTTLATYHLALLKARRSSLNREGYPLSVKQGDE